MPTRSTTSLILAVAALVGLGTTVYTIATMDPAEIPVIDDLDAANGMVRANPQRADSWNRLLDALAARGELIAMATQWLHSRDPQWVAEQGAEALLWYWISDWTARTTERYNPDFSRPESVAARTKAIDLLIELSLRSPSHMQYWHWNSLAWAGARSGLFDLARGALERTEEAMRRMPPDYPAGEFATALLRLSNCWRTVGNEEESDAVFDRAADLVEKHGEDWRNGFTLIWLARRSMSGDDMSSAELILTIAEERYTRQMEDADMRHPWRGMVSALRDIGAPHERVKRAIDALAAEVDAHGETRELSWNDVGWEYDAIDLPELAQDAWRRWLESRRRQVEVRPTGGNLYNLACAYALLGDADNAVAALERAIDEGWNDSRLATDRSFDAIRDDPRIQEIIRSAMDDFYERTLGKRP